MPPSFLPMTVSVIAAVAYLQKHLLAYPLNTYQSERYDRALHTLLKYPHKQNPPFHLSRNALSDARKVLQHRQDSLPTEEIGEASALEWVRDPVSLCALDEVDARIDAEAWIRRAPFTSTQREILAILIQHEGADGAEEVAARFGLTLQQARVRICHVHKRARQLRLEFPYG